MSCVTKGCTEDSITLEDISDTSTANCVKFEGKCVTCDNVSAALNQKNPYEFFRDPVYSIYGIKGTEAKVNADFGRQIQNECNIASPVQREPDIYRVDPADEESIRHNAREILHFYEHHNSSTAATLNAIRFVKILARVGALLKVLDNQDTNSEHLVKRSGDLIQHIIQDEDKRLPYIVHNQGIDIIKQIPFILLKWNALNKKNPNNKSLLRFFQQNSACFPDRITKFVDTLTKPVVGNKRKRSHRNKKMSQVQSRTKKTLKSYGKSGTSKGRRSQKRRLSQKKRVLTHR